MADLVDMLLRYSDPQTALHDPAIDARGFQPFPTLPPLRHEPKQYLENERWRSPNPFGGDEAIAAQIGGDARNGDWLPAGGGLAAIFLGAAAPRGGAKSTAQPRARLPENVRWALDPHGEGRMWPHPDQWPNEVNLRVTPEQRAKAEAAGYNPDLLLFRGSTTSKADPLRRLRENEKLNGQNVEPGLSEREYPYFTDTPRIANAYAAGETYHYDHRNFDAVRKRGEGSGSNITPAWALRDKILTVPYSASGHIDPYMLKRVLGDQAWLDKHWYGMTDIATAAREKGYNMVKFTGMGDLGGKQNQYLPLHPDAIRSPWAKFDPANAKSGNFMGSMAAPAIAGPALAALLSQYGVEPSKDYNP